MNVVLAVFAVLLGTAFMLIGLITTALIVGLRLGHVENLYILGCEVIPPKPTNYNEQKP